MAEMPTKVAALVGRVAAGGLDSMAYLDPGKADEREAIEYFLDAAGKGPDRYPALHAAKDGGGTEAPAKPLDECTLVEAGSGPHGEAQAQAWLGSAGGSYLSGVHTMMAAKGSGEVLASGSATQVGGGLVRARTAAGAAATPEMTGVAFFHAQRSPQEALRFGLTAVPVERLGTAPTIAILAPIEVRGKKPGRVVIGIARQKGWLNTDCDYIYPEVANVVQPDRLVVPFEGTAEFSEAVTLPALNIHTSLWCNHMPLNVWETAAELAAGFKQVSSTKISWSFPYDDQPITKTKSLKYEPLPEADDNISAFYFRFQLKAASGLVTLSIFSTSWPDKPTGGYTKEIDKLEYWWHCVDAEAEVTLADGSTRKLIEIDNQTEVRLRGGGQSMVEATTLDIHDIDSEDVVMKLTTNAGRSLIISALHPVMSAGQPVMARDLQPGQTIEVEGGTDQVAACVPEPEFGGQLGNLSLAATGTQAFFANGIAVGDFGTLTAYREQVRHDPDYMLPRLPESHHQDYLSGLADARRQR